MMTKEQLKRELKDIDRTDREQKSDIEVFPIFDIQTDTEESE